MSTAELLSSHAPTLHAEKLPDYDPTKRNYEDVVTWLAEVLPGSMRNPVEYQYIHGDLYAEDGSNVRDFFDKGLEDASLLPNRLSFERRRRLTEKNEYHEMLALFHDGSVNTLLVVSDFPAELMAATEDVGGYNVARKQTMLRLITKTKSGSLRVETQTLDRSDRRALEDIYTFCGHTAQPGELLGQTMKFSYTEAEQRVCLDFARDTYDSSLAAREGGQWYAGRKGSDTRNTNEFVRQQTDLLEYYFKSNIHFGGGRNEYNLAAAIKQRFEEKEMGKRITNTSGFFMVNSTLVDSELESAGMSAMKRGETFSGCGATIASGNGLSSIEELSALGYGNKSEEDQYGSLKFQCKKGHTNIRPRGKLIPNCQVCKRSVKC